MAKRKRTNNDLQNITQTTKDRTTRTLLDTVVELRCSGRVSSCCATSGHTHNFILDRLPYEFPYLWGPPSWWNS